MFASGAADIINPDVCAVGGIDAIFDIAAMAHVHGAAISPHNSTSTSVGLALTAQVASLMPNFMVAEVFVNLIEDCAAPAVEPLPVAAGWLRCPMRGRLGIDLDVERLRRHDCRPSAPRKLRRPVFRPFRQARFERFAQAVGHQVEGEHGQQAGGTGDRADVPGGARRADQHRRADDQRRQRVEQGLAPGDALRLVARPAP